MKKTTEARLNLIQKYLLDHERASVTELSKLLKVTPEMTRKYLSFLEEKRFLFRTHGGAILRNSNVDVPLSVRSKEKVDLKKILCNFAIDFINDDDMVFFDPSSTLLHLGKLIRLKKNLAIVTNCFDFLDSAKETSHSFYFLGGGYSKTGNRTKGQFQLNMIKAFSFDVTFFGADGIAGNGIGSQSEDAVFLNTEILSRSKKNILVFDSSKFDTSCRYQYADFSDFDIFITDLIPEKYRDIITTETIIETSKYKRKRQY